MSNTSRETSPSKEPVSEDATTTAKDPQDEPTTVEDSPPKVKSREEQIAEMKARKIESIKSRINFLTTELAATKEKLSAGEAVLKNPAQQTVKQHIHLLHEYNEIRDIGQGLIGMIADNRSVRISEVYEEFGVSIGD